MRRSPLPVGGFGLSWILALASSAAAAAEDPPWLSTRVAPEESIAFTLYTLNEGTLKLTAQLYPLAPEIDRRATLEVETDAGWREVASDRVSEEPYGWPQEDVGRWTVHFRVEGWDDTRAWSYRVVAAGGAATYGGEIRPDPKEKREIVVAAFTGNSNQDRRMRPDIVTNVRAQDPDLLFFSGDQSYDHAWHYQAWLLFGKQFGELLRNYPSVTIPDDHDIGQGNLWGENGVEAETSAGDTGGYYYSPAYVNAVQEAQTWHLPDARDPTPVARGIGVYYTRLKVGRVDFAIVEDRKFKTGPGGVVPQMGPRPDHVTDPDYDPQAVDVPEARLLGDRQIAFLDTWAREWTGVYMKAVLSQTVFANAAHRHGPGAWDGQQFVPLDKADGERLVADLDSNGWPQHARNRALRSIRRAFAFMIAGDQHLATVIHHGTNRFRDAGVSFAAPSIVNYYVRWWDPLEPPVEPGEGPLPLTGSYYDGLRNKITMLAYVNPDPERRHRWGEWGDRAEGYGLIRFDVESRRITIECWPRGIDVTAPGAAPYEGFPVVVEQQDNYGREPTAWLPIIEVTGAREPVIEVVDKTYGDLVYTLRIRGDRFQPGVFRDGPYTVRVSGQPGPERTLAGLPATIEKPEHVVTVDLSPP